MQGVVNFSMKPRAEISGLYDRKKVVVPRYSDVIVFIRFPLELAERTKEGRLTPYNYSSIYSQLVNELLNNLNKIIEDAWKHKDNPEEFLRKFQEVFEEYRRNAAYLFEYANALDFLGKEPEAIPLYRMAIEMGLYGKMRTRAEIQLGSSLSVTGESESAINILSRVYGETGEPAALVFLCIALFRSGEIKKSLKTSLRFILSSNEGLLPEYNRALSYYVDEID